MPLSTRVDALAARIAQEFSSLRSEGVSAVQVTTGEEVRPDTLVVFWIGGSTKPTNMAEGVDLWFKPEGV